MDIIQVAIPTYNRDLYLDKLMSSIPSDIKISVSDNGSFVSSELKKKYANASFVSHSSVIAIFDNWNCAAKNAFSLWLSIPSDDDVFFSNAFDKISQYILKYPDADILIFGHNIIDENDSLSPGWCPIEETVFDAPLGYEVFKYGVEARMPCIIFKTATLRELGYFDNNFELTASDSDLVQRALLSGKSVFIPEILGAYRIWKGNLTSQRVATKQWLEEIDYWQQKISKIYNEKYKKTKMKIPSSQIMDEVYANNLLAGIANKKLTSGFREAFVFAKSVRFPWRAKLITQLRIIKTLLFK
jgi:glycosyltransferase involved in cell wall biosynthesis